MCVAVATFVTACSNDSTTQATPTSSVTVMNGPEVEVTPEKQGNANSTIFVGESALYCNPDAGSMELPLDGETSDFIGIVKVANQGSFTRIEWEKPGAYVVIVNDQQWGYVNKSEGPPPASLKLVHSAWGGQIKHIKMCGKR
jgi:hypothetical protein